MENTYKSMCWRVSVAALCAFAMFFISCKDSDTVNYVPYDPSVPIKISSFMPDSGRVATQMLIYGENFGGDKEKISVLIDGKKAAVIGVTPDGTIIYCLVPSLKDKGEYREDGEELNASIKVVVEGAESDNYEKRLAYTFSQNVSTFLGFTDQDGNSAVVDGGFSHAQLNTPSWLTFDKETAQGTARNFFLIEESTEPNWNNGSVRFIDLQSERVSTVFRAGNNLNRPRTISFTLEHDTMIVANDAGEWSSIGTVIIPRDSLTGRFDRPGNATPWTIAMRHKQCNGGAIHPVTGDYWFNSYQNGQIFKVFQRGKTPWRYGKSATELVADGEDGANFGVISKIENGWEFCIQIAPSGSFAYLIVRNQHYIARMPYNYEKNVFENPQPFAGSKMRSGFRDGLGLDAMFNTPQQGAFDKDDNFYVCDGRNNCIRKVTPQGQVSTFAGRPESAAGYSDGALRDARFSMPLGLIYDDINQTFYVADRDNRRIRTIKVE